jgi:DcaP outer membrane protein
MTVTQNEMTSRGWAGEKRTLPKWFLALALVLVSASYARAQDRSTMDIYGFIMLDMGHDFKTIDPDWFDTMRVTKLPSFEGQFGEDHDTFAGIRQTRFGVKTETPTSMGPLKTQFEFELFGTGVDAGQTTIRMRHAYGELGQFGAGQTWSPFMDPDVFPNSLEYWGPTGMVFYRNVQFRWTPINKGGTSLMVAVERPGASGDQGNFAGRNELSGIQSRFPVPDLTGAFTYGRSWGYVRAAAAVRRINWDDTVQDQFELGDHVTGWGINLSSNIKVKNDVVRLQFVYGEGIENYMNDTPVDVGIKNNPGDPVQPFKGEALPVTGVVAFLDHKWSERWGSTIGYSWQDVDNSDGQSPDAFKTGQYALGNVVFYPVSNVMVGGEFQWGQRENNSDGFKSDGYKLQFSFKYNFTKRIGG